MLDIKVQFVINNEQMNIAGMFYFAAMTYFRWLPEGLMPLIDFAERRVQLHIVSFRLS